MDKPAQLIEQIFWWQFFIANKFEHFHENTLWLYDQTTPDNLLLRHKN